MTQQISPHRHCLTEIVSHIVGRAVVTGGCAFIPLSLAFNAVLTVRARGDTTPN